MFWPRLGPHRGYVTHHDAAVHGPHATPWLSSYGLATPWPLSYGLAGGRTLGPCPGRIPTLFRCASRLARILHLALPTCPDTPWSSHAHAARFTTSWVFLVLHIVCFCGFMLPLYCCFSSQPSRHHHSPRTASILISTTLGQDPPPALMPQSLAPALPASTFFAGLYVTCTLCTPCGSCTAACPCPRVHTQPASPPPSALTPSRSVYLA